MLGDVEVDGPHDLDHVGHGVLRQQHAAERALLGEQVVRRGAVAGAGCALALFTRETEMGDRQGLLRFCRRGGSVHF
ncbi:hypothetical protein GCM10017602_08120 [Herbiconiux flava]|nr:hypothetical protein GCM10017602_08120 [Herbiconiux flava]